MNPAPDAVRTYRYPAASLVPDGLRSLAGLVFTVVPLVSFPVPPWFGAVLAAGAALFAMFGVSTAMRGRTAVRVGGDAIEVGRRRLPWAGLTRVKLRYFRVRRERERDRRSGGGWLELVLAAGGGRRARIDSRLDGFDDVLRRVAEAAAAANLPLDPATRANFEAAGAPVVDIAADPDPVSGGDPGSGPDSGPGGGAGSGAPSGGPSARTPGDG